MPGDLGCGPGTITVPLASRVGHVYAVDIEPAMISEGRKAAAHSTDVIGPGYRQEHGPVAHPAEGRDDALRRSAFSLIQTARWDQTFTRTLDELVGLQYSFSYSSPAVLGNKQAAFEELLRRELTSLRPNGTFENTVPIETVLATRP
ncbi:class I SAM-dependent methyltransferase [Streptomyces sp. SBC-4]|nr:class I SAM-dependent methyltransferase [Streptomyces sp. SBC-4]MDV5144002.1 class I SAM-dependent methyltransferase [Streptomyces sp. SBC-4]